MTSLGVLSIQGDFAEHLATLQKMGTLGTEVRLPRDLDGLDGLIIPGGESTTIARLMDLYDLRQPLRERIRDGLAVWGTCAGLILLATALDTDRPQPLGLLDVTVERNAFGRQLDSFEMDLPVSGLGEAPFHAIFIRAPVITRVGPQAQALASLPDGRVVAAQQGRMLGTAFHPELTADLRFHRYFLDLAAEPAE